MISHRSWQDGLAAGRPDKVGLGPGGHNTRALFLLQERAGGAVSDQSGLAGIVCMRLVASKDNAKYDREKSDT